MVNYFYNIKYTDGYESYNIAWFVSNREYSTERFKYIINDTITKIAISKELSDKPYDIYSIIFDYDKFNTILLHKYGLKRLNDNKYPEIVFDESTREFEVLEYELGRGSWCYDDYDSNIKHDEKQDNDDKLSSHYKVNGLDPIGAFKQGLISKEEYKGFLKGNIIKYVVRCDYKGNPADDLTKATNYLTLLREQIAIETIEEDNND
jgi:hypothetical protein